MMMFRRLISGAAVAAICLPVPLAKASERDGGPVPVAVGTNFRGVAPDRVKRIEASLRERGVKDLGLAGVAVSDKATTQVVFHVRSLVDETEATAAVSDYGTHIEVLSDGKRVGEIVVTFCKEKGEAELVDCALEGLPEAIGLIPVDEGASVPTPLVEAESKPKRETEKVPLAPLGADGVAGIAVAVVGVGFGVFGARDLIRGDVDASEGMVFVEGDDFSKRGIGFVVVGGVLMATGAALIARGVIRTRRKQRERAVQAEIQATPSFSGLRFTGRF